MSLKKKVVLVGVLGVAMASSAVSAQSMFASTETRHFTDYQFDRASGRAFNQDASRPPYTNESICGGVLEITQSPLFGSRNDYKDLYPVLGQIDAELSQIGAIHDDVRPIIEEMLLNAKNQIDEGIKLEKEMRESIQADIRDYPESASELQSVLSDSISLSYEAWRSANLNTMDSIMGMLDFYHSKRRTPMVTKLRDINSLDEWTLCRAYWNAEIEGSWSNNHLRDVIRGADRQL